MITYKIISFIPDTFGCKIGKAEFALLDQISVGKTTKQRTIILWKNGVIRSLVATAGNQRYRTVVSETRPWYYPP